MCKVNFVSEFNMIMRYARNNGLSLRERMLWIALFYIANDRAIYNERTEEYDWPDGFISVSNGELNLYSCLDKRGIDTLRNSLRQRGVIDFTPGVKNKKNPAYRLNYLSIDVGYKSVPNDVPNTVPNDVPNHVPNSVPNTVPNDVPKTPPYSKYNKKTETPNQFQGKGLPLNRNGGVLVLNDQSGFVDLGSEDISDSEFVPLPWKERAE